MPVTVRVARGATVLTSEVGVPAIGRALETFRAPWRGGATGYQVARENLWGWGGAQGKRASALALAAAHVGSGVLRDLAQQGEVTSAWTGDLSLLRSSRDVARS